MYSLKDLDTKGLDLNQEKDYMLFCQDSNLRRCYACKDFDEREVMYKGGTRVIFCGDCYDGSKIKNLRNKIELLSGELEKKIRNKEELIEGKKKTISELKENLKNNLPEEKKATLDYLFELRETSAALNNSWNDMKFVINDLRSKLEIFPSLEEDINKLNDLIDELHEEKKNLEELFNMRLEAKNNSVFSLLSMRRSYEKKLSTEREEIIKALEVSEKWHQEKIQELNEKHQQEISELKAQIEQLSLNK